MLSAQPLSLYIHLPWCISKCPYCDFNSHALKSALPETAYIDAIIADLDESYPLLPTKKIESIFIGGGTPSLFSGSSIKRLLEAVRVRFDFIKSIEITLEANPGTVEQGNFVAFLEAGINRLSLGIQSFSNQQLVNLGRIHGREEALQAIENAKIAGFTNINCDIMFGLPKQTITEALADLTQTIATQPNHISWYQLTLEPNTLFAAKPPPLPVEDTLATIMEQGIAQLKQHGYQRYEISAYAKQQRVSQHNINYWQFGDYIGIGAGAHSKLTNPSTGHVIRLLKYKHPTTFIKNTSKIQQQLIIDKTDLPFEFMLNALRLFQPITFKHFEQSTGIARQEIYHILQQAQDNDLIIINDEEFILTDLGCRFYNDVVTLFL